MKDFEDKVNDQDWLLSNLDRPPTFLDRLRFYLYTRFNRRPYKSFRCISIKGGFLPKLFLYNGLVNSKYNILTFIPLVLYSQFSSFINLFYLAMCLSQLVPVLRVESPIVHMFPLSLVIFVYSLKEGIEDYKRHVRDKEHNRQQFCYFSDKGYVDVASEKIKLGQLLMLKQGERVPADILLLKTSEPNGASFVRTDQLDGETDWKLKRAVATTQAMSVEDIFNLLSVATVEEPKPDFYNFLGKITFYYPVKSEDERPRGGYETDNANSDLVISRSSSSDLASNGSITNNTNNVTSTTNLENITTNTAAVTNNHVDGIPRGSNTTVSKVNDDEIDSLLIYNGKGYVGKIKLDNRFYKSNKNKAIRSKLLFTPNTSIINTIPTKGKESAGKDGEEVVKNDSGVVGTSNTGGDGAVTANVGLENDKESAGEAKAEGVSYCGSNNNNNLIVVTESKIYNISNSKLKLCKKGYNMFKYLKINPHDQKLLYLTNYKPPLKDILMLGFNDGVVSIYNSPDVKINNSAVRLKLKLKKMKDNIIKFFLSTSPQDLVDKHLFLCTKMGNCIKVNVKDIVDRLLREKRKRKNVKLVRLREKDEVSSFCLTGDDQQILILTNLGKCKLINSSDIKLQKTKGKGYKILRQPRASRNNEVERIVSCLSVESSDPKRSILLISRGGVLCKKQLSVGASPKHHKTKKFWSNIPANDELSYSKLL